MALDFGLGEWKVEMCLNQSLIYRAKRGKLINPLFTKINPLPDQAMKPQPPEGAEVSWLGLAGGGFFLNKGLINLPHSPCKLGLD